MLRQRIITGAIVLLLFLGGVFFLPGMAWAILLLVVAGLGAYEWGRLAKVSTVCALTFTLAVCGACLVLLCWPSSAAQMALVALGASFWLTAAPWILATREHPLSTSSMLVSGWLILVSAWESLVILRASPGRLVILLGVVWIADSAAYFTGRRFGRRKLAPSISPGKTWEGVAGAVAAVSVYFLLVWIIVAPPSVRGSVSGDMLLVAFLTVLGIVGDLFESWLKRRAGVKDSGTLLPGHGGVLDRIDAILAIAPLAALVQML